ncbi:MAG: DNA-binding response regulator [Cytophagia bacterium]|nr:DNA-binding response regulator [Cytophagia bacterium]
MSAKNLALLVDPLAGGRQRLKTLLVTFYKVQEFSNSEAVMSKVHRMSPHLLVLVIRSAFPDPWGIVRYIRAHSRLSHLPILCLADPPGPHFWEQALEAGADLILATDCSKTLFQLACRRLVEQMHTVCKYSYQKYLYDDKKAPLTSEDERFLGLLHEFTRQNMHRVDLQVADMADALSLSCSQLDRRLDRLLGMSPKQFLSEHRLNAAFHLLATRRGNVSEVSALTGFKSLSYFSTRFSERFQANPSVVRENRELVNYSGPWKEMATRLGLDGPPMPHRSLRKPQAAVTVRRRSSGDEPIKKS